MPPPSPPVSTGCLSFHWLCTAAALPCGGDRLLGCTCMRLGLALLQACCHTTLTMPCPPTLILWPACVSTHHPADALAAHSRHRSLSGATAVAGGHHHHGAVTHTNHIDAAQGQPPAAGMKENGVYESAAAPPVGSSDSAAEVGRLQAEVSQLQAHIAELQARLAAEPQPAVGKEDAAPPPSAA